MAAISSVGLVHCFVKAKTRSSIQQCYICIPNGHSRLYFKGPEACR